MCDQKKLIKINAVQNGLALIHHAALKNDTYSMQLILNFKGVNLNLLSDKGLRACEMTTNGALRKMILNHHATKPPKRRSKAQAE